MVAGWLLRSGERDQRCHVADAAVDAARVVGRISAGAASERELVQLRLRVQHGGSAKHGLLSPPLAGEGASRVQPLRPAPTLTLPRKRERGHAADGAAGGPHIRDFHPNRCPARSAPPDSALRPAVLVDGHPRIAQGPFTNDLPAPPKFRVVLPGAGCTRILRRWRRAIDQGLTGIELGAIIGARRQRYRSQ